MADRKTPEQLARLEEAFVALLELAQEFEGDDHLLGATLFYTTEAGHEQAMAKFDPDVVYINGEDPGVAILKAARDNFDYRINQRTTN